MVTTVEVIRAGFFMQVTWTDTVHAISALRSAGYAAAVDTNFQTLMFWSRYTGHGRVFTWVKSQQAGG